MGVDDGEVVGGRGRGPFLKWHLIAMYLWQGLDSFPCNKQRLQQILMVYSVISRPKGCVYAPFPLKGTPI